MKLFLTALLLLVLLLICAIIAALLVAESEMMYEGKTVLWRGKKYVVLEKMTGDRIRIARKSMPHMSVIVKRSDLSTNRWWD